MRSIMQDRLRWDAVLLWQSELCRVGKWWCGWWVVICQEKRMVCCEWSGFPLFLCRKCVILKIILSLILKSLNLFSFDILLFFGVTWNINYVIGLQTSGIFLWKTWHEVRTDDTHSYPRWTWAESIASTCWCIGRWIVLPRVLEGYSQL